jgi:uncharacterized protein (TIGR02594 family)
VDANGGMIRRLASALGPLPAGPFSSPAWLAAAHGEEGVKEESTRDKNNPRILEYLATAKHLATIEDTITRRGSDGKPVKDEHNKVIKDATGYKMSEVDETAWCACFVNWCLDQAGEKRLKGATAQKYNEWGREQDHVGAITVIYREPFNDSSTGYHVGFLIGGNRREGYVCLLGGNQNNSVCRKWFIGIDDHPTHCVPHGTHRIFPRRL